MKPILIIGSAGHAKAVIESVEKESRLKIVGVVDPELKKGDRFSGYPVLSDDDRDLPELVNLHKVRAGIIAIGDNWRRHHVALKVESLVPGFEFECAVHPSASIGRNVEFGPGTVVMAGVSINPDSKIGSFCILNTNCSLDHDGVLGDFSSLAPGATVGGNVSIGEFSAISLGANVLHRMTIGSHTVVGAGALVNKPLGNRLVAYGVPAKTIRSREAGDPYL